MRRTRALRNGGGTPTTTDSSDDRVEGNFSANGTYTSLANGQPQEVEVSIPGSFEAPGGDFFTPPVN